MKVKAQNLMIEPALSGGCIVRFETTDLRYTPELTHKYMDKPMTAEIKEPRKGRSLNANSYCWVLCEKIAQKVRATKEDVYKKAIREVGKFSDMPPVSKEDARDFIKGWQHNGLGWFVDYLLRGDLVELRVYFGSSVYDSKEMARLIDYLVDEAEMMGIETMTPGEIARLKTMWGGA